MNRLLPLLFMLTPPKDATVYAREYLDMLRQRDFQRAAAMHDSTMAGALPEEKLKVTVLKLCAGVPGPGPCTAVRSEKVNGYENVICTAAVGKGIKDIKVVLDSAHRVAGLFFQDAAGVGPPASYVDKTRFTETETELHVGRFMLPGTLTLPKGPGPFPAVVLVHGSGPHDRHETVGPNRPFEDLAQGLGSMGVASFRYEKRTRIYGANISDAPALFTVQDETVADAVAAVKMLQARKDIRGVVVTGHSQGGHVAPRVAQQAGGVKGVVLLAGNVSPVADLVLAQLRHMQSLGGPEAQQAGQMLPQIQAVAQRIRALTTKDAQDATLLLGAPPAYHLDLAQNPPTQTLRMLALPTLLVGGGRDYQVPPSEMELWKQGLKGSPWATYKSYPMLNHLMMAGEGKPSPGEYAVAGHVDATLVADIAAFVQRATVLAR